MPDQGGQYIRLDKQEFINLRALYLPKGFNILSRTPGEEENSLLECIFEAWI